MASSPFLPPDGQLPPVGVPAVPAAPGLAPLDLLAQSAAQLQPPEEKKAIDKLEPGSELHASVLTKLEAMRKFSQCEMTKHYWRWNFGEQRIQAYVQQEDYERIVGSMNGYDGRPPEPINVIVPYSYATLHAAATFVYGVLLGRRPIFPLMSIRGTTADKARYMEASIQSQLDYSRAAEELWQHIWDSIVYNVAPIRINYEEIFGSSIQRDISGQRIVVDELQYSGNIIRALDPYAILPDPRVPLHRAHLDGDFLFAKVESSETQLLDLEREGALKWVKQALKSRNVAATDYDSPRGDSDRRAKIGLRGEMLTTPSNVVKFRLRYEGTVRIVPKDWKLGTSTRSELWKFTWLQGQIIQAEPLNLVHNQHPITIAEPTSFGHDFMSVAMSDMIGPFQDILSWLVSSRMENVRTAINNQFVADPSAVEVNDIRQSAIGRIIRLKQAAMGLPIKNVLQQIAVSDVTQGHVNDIQLMRVLADTITGVNDNLRGIQTAGGRRSATEARLSMQAGATRLSQMAIRISSQSFHPMVQQMISNTQQLMPDEMWIETAGDNGDPVSLKLQLEQILGSFNYQISDGSLPFDKQALLEEWKEILFGVARDPELRAGWDLNKMFEYVAELGGARNIGQFKKQLPAPGQVPFQAGAGNNPGAQPGTVPIGLADPQGPLL